MSIYGGNIFFKFRSDGHDLTIKDVLSFNWTYNILEKIEMDQNYDYLYKILLVGDAGVGKTSLMK